MARMPAGLTNLFNKLGLLWSRVMPHWAQKKIDSELYLLNTSDRKGFRLPRGFEQKTMRTPDGNISTYRVGKGPAIVFIHGWGGGAYEFFSLMRGLNACGFTAIAFDHFAHEASDAKPATLQQLIKTTNHVLNSVKKTHSDGLYCVVAHGLGCMVSVNASPATMEGLPLFLISPVFNYKLYFLKKLSTLKLHPDLLKEYAQEFNKNYPKEYARLELANRLDRYADDTVIAHDANDKTAPIADTLKFCKQHPLTKLVVTRQFDHHRIISSETVWHELKSHINYEDTTINFSSMLVSGDD